MEKNWFNWSKNSLLLTILFSLAVTVFLAYLATIFDSSSTFFQNLFSSLMGIGAFVAAVFAALVIGEMIVQRTKMGEQLEEMKNQTLEMQNQRILQYSPELIAENDFKIYYHNCNEFLKEIPELKDNDLRKELGVWSKSYEKPKTYHNLILKDISEISDEGARFFKLSQLISHVENDVGIKIYNVGNGVAKQITYKWECEFDELFEFLLKDSNKKVLFPKKTIETIAYYSYGNNITSVYKNSFLKKGNYNLLLPHRSPTDFLVIPLPRDVLGLLGYFCKAEGLASINVPMYLTIDYLGIDNVLHVKKYMLECVQAHINEYVDKPIGDPNKYDPDYFAYYFEITEVKDTKETSK
ncbi:hypothetical protein [Methanococcus maripaludis]|uniref:Uncharacterized protein n=1 Tax=Methanococcus maripaludis TaxID=39152 RepID=A0A7J9SHV5_METMI|nr:hypothetical protein [Methanococcus maripaludis]MBB6497774.1 hypothetical protein [Methanococcus maripaludis]